MEGRMSDQESGGRGEGRRRVGGGRGGVIKGWRREGRVAAGVVKT